MTLEAEDYGSSSWKVRKFEDLKDCELVDFVTG
jgi:hypothetical protein